LLPHVPRRAGRVHRAAAVPGPPALQGEGVRGRRGREGRGSEWFRGRAPRRPAERARPGPRPEDRRGCRGRPEAAGPPGRLGHGRVVSKDPLPEVEAQLREARQALEAARQALREAETADPVRELKTTAETARKALWALETALEGDDRCLLKESLRGVLAGVKVGADPYQT